MSAAELFVAQSGKEPGSKRNKACFPGGSVWCILVMFVGQSSAKCWECNH